MIGSGWSYYYDEAAAAPYLKNDATTGVLSYDDPKSIMMKRDFALNKSKLGGVFIWKLGLDKMADNSQPLFEAASGR